MVAMALLVAWLRRHTMQIRDIEQPSFVFAAPCSKFSRGFFVEFSQWVWSMLPYGRNTINNLFINS